MLHGFTYNFTVSELVNFNILERQVNLTYEFINLHTSSSQSKYYLYLSVHPFPHPHMCTFWLLASWSGSKRQYEILLSNHVAGEPECVGLPAEYHMLR